MAHHFGLLEFPGRSNIPTQLQEQELRSDCLTEKMRSRTWLWSAPLKACKPLEREFRDPLDGII